MAVIDIRIGAALDQFLKDFEERCPGCLLHAAKPMMTDDSLDLTVYPDRANAALAVLRQLLPAAAVQEVSFDSGLGRFRVPVSVVLQARPLPDAG